MKEEIMKHVTSFIHFDGNCRQAMSFYQQCLGAELQLNPYPDTEGKPSSDSNAKIMHSQLSHGGAPLLMASDGAPGASHEPGKNFSVSIECDSLGEIERLFAAFSQNGQVTLPLGDMPWGARFGMLTDQFDIQWFFNCTLTQ
jgi:PhnB protein